MTDPNNNSNYLKHKEYFLNYQARHRQPRKYNFCLICGTSNENKRYYKVCSAACSRTLRRVTVLETVRDFNQKKKINKLTFRS